jgi:hypothetical protein
MRLAEEVKAAGAEATCIGFNEALEEESSVGRIELEFLSETTIVYESLIHSIRVIQLICASPQIIVADGADLLNYPVTFKLER